MSFQDLLRRHRGLVLAFALPSFIPSGTGCAQTALLAGVVMDTAGHPLEAAQVVAVRGGRQTLSDRRGVFLLPGLRKGREIIQVRRVGYVAQVFELEIEGTDTLRVGVTLARDSIQRLPDVATTAPPPPTLGEHLEREAYERIVSSGAPTSSLIPRAELDGLNGGRLFPVLVKHGLKPRIDRRGKERLACPRGGGQPTIYLDGLRLGPDFDFETYAPDAVELIEVYGSSAARPTQYNSTGSACTILIWSRR